MIEEAYVSHDVAKLLKEKGFNEPCRMYWEVDVEKVEKNLSEYNSCLHDRTNKELEILDGTYNKKRYSAPTQQMVMRWLREVHYLSIEICYRFCFGWFVDIQYTNRVTEAKEFRDVRSNLYDSYEEVAEVGIRYCLENLI